MDRPEPGLVKWSPDMTRDAFIHINLQHRVVNLYEPTGHARRGRFDYKLRASHSGFPHLTTYDWSPSVPGLVAVGTSSGMVNLLRVDDDSNAYMELPVKMPRMCHAVAFSTSGKLAVGLERIRLDQCLHIWDVNHLRSTDPQLTGFPVDANAGFYDAVHRLEPSVCVTSAKFFEDNPETLVVGIKGQGIRLHDLRLSHTPVVTFQSKCTNNINIDYADQNYFVSSALDTPGIVLWDRRATSRPVASRSYVEAIETEQVPWGCALRLRNVLHMDSNPTDQDHRHSFIRSIRFCREHRGLLGVLGRTGQLKIINTLKEPELDPAGGPELLQVHRSHDMDVSFANSSHRNDRIVSFDWATLGSDALRPRLLVLRSNGAFEVLETSSATSSYLFDLIPWQVHHRGLEDGHPYHSIIQLESDQEAEILGPLFVEEALSNAPVFGKHKADTDAIIKKSLSHHASTVSLVKDLHVADATLPPSFAKARSVGDKMTAIRECLRGSKAAMKTRGTMSAGFTVTLAGPSPPTKVLSWRDYHEGLLNLLLPASGLPREAQVILDHVMLLRAKEKYLFNPMLNRTVVSDDCWLRFLWHWIYDAETAAEGDRMVQDPLDLGYMGVYPIWMSDLGNNPSSRLTTQDASPPDATMWDGCIGAICEKRDLLPYEGVLTRRPGVRQLCLDICRWGDRTMEEATQSLSLAMPDVPMTSHTMATARALFRGDTTGAVEILKAASGAHPELMFVSLALQLMNERQGGVDEQARSGGVDDQGEYPVLGMNKLDLDLDLEAASRTDPYLRAISSVIATGDWATVVNQTSLPLSDRVYVAVRQFDDDRLTAWLADQVETAVETGDVEAIVLTGITDRMVDIFARYVCRYGDYQTAALVLTLCAPRYIDDFRCTAWRSAYCAYLQRHRAYLQRTKFQVESTRRSRGADAFFPPSIKPASRQIVLRCVYCEAESSIVRGAMGTGTAATGSGLAAVAPPGSGLADDPAATLFPTSDEAPTATTTGSVAAAVLEQRNPLMATSINAGISCPNCGRHLPRCVVCLQIVGVPRSDSADRPAGRFPTFCMRCEHVLHLDHARQWFARHVECPVPECRCRCNFQANPDLNYN